MCSLIYILSVNQEQCSKRTQRVSTRAQYTTKKPVSAPSTCGQLWPRVCVPVSMLKCWHTHIFAAATTSPTYATVYPARKGIHRRCPPLVTADVSPSLARSACGQLNCVLFDGTRNNVPPSLQNGRRKVPLPADNTQRTVGLGVCMLKL